MKNIKPTESELEILNIIWQKGAATVKEVHEILSLQKQSGYTTTLKLMQIMNEKGILKRKEKGKLHIYEAGIKKEKTQNHLMQNMIDNVFEGSASNLVLQALGNKKITQQEIDAIKKYLNTL